MASICVYPAFVKDIHNNLQSRGLNKESDRNDTGSYLKIEYQTGKEAYQNIYWEEKNSKENFEIYTYKYHPNVSVSYIMN